MFFERCVKNGVYSSLADYVGEPGTSCGGGLVISAGVGDGGIGVGMSGGTSVGDSDSPVLSMFKASGEDGGDRAPVDEAMTTVH